MTQALARLELWSDYEVAGGLRRALIASPLAVDERVTLDGEDTLTVRVHHDEPALQTLDTPAGLSNAEPQAVLRTILEDGSVSERRIVAHTDRDDQGQTQVTILARGALFELSMRGLVRRLHSDGAVTHDFQASGLTIEQHVRNYILPALAEAGQPWWDVGTIESTEAVQVRYTHDSPLAALRKLATAGTSPLELAVRFDRAAMKYRLDLVARVGGSSPVVQVHSSLSLRAMGLTRSAEDMVTRVYAFGAGDEAQGEGTMAGNAWLVRYTRSNPVGSVPHDFIAVYDPADGPGPIAFDGQYAPTADGSYRLVPIGRSDVGTYAIVGSLQERQEFEVRLVSGPATFPNAMYRIMAPDPSGGARALTSVEDATRVATYGPRVGTLELSDVSSVLNYLPNPLARVLNPPGGNSPLPRDWALAAGSGATVQLETNPLYYRSGGRSVRVTFTTTSSWVSIPTKFARLGGLTGRLSYFADLWCVRGRAAVDLIVNLAQPATLPGNTTPTTQIWWPINWNLVFPTTPVDQIPKAETQQLNQWERVGLEGIHDLQTYPGTNADLMIHASVVPCEVLIDAVQLTNSPAQRDLIEGTGSNVLLQQANERLLRYRDLAVSIDVDALDVTTIDDQQFPYNRYVLGGGVQLVHAALGQAVTTRVLGWSRDWMQPASLRLDISQSRADVTRVLASRTPSALPALLR